MPCCSQPRRNASLWNSVALSTDNSRGVPTIGHATPSTPRSCSQGCLSQAMWARHSPTDVADGGLQGHDHADGTPARLIEADTEVGPADRLAFPLVHHDHVDDRVIDLHPLQDPVD